MSKVKEKLKVRYPNILPEEVVMFYKNHNDKYYNLYLSASKVERKPNTGKETGGFKSKLVSSSRMWFEYETQIDKVSSLLQYIDFPETINRLYENNPSNTLRLLKTLNNLDEQFLDEVNLLKEYSEDIKKFRKIYDLTYKYFFKLKENKELSSEFDLGEDFYLFEKHMLNKAKRLYYLRRINKFINANFELGKSAEIITITNALSEKLSDKAYSYQDIANYCSR